MSSVKNPPAGCQRLIPHLAYEDAPAAIEFLTSAFGFEERFRIPMPDGTVGHAELGYADNCLMVATANEAFGLASPKSLPAVHAMICCYVDDVDAHYERAKAAGATILGEPADMPYGDRAYRAVDSEGNRWAFQQHVRDVADEDVKDHYAKSE